MQKHNEISKKLSFKKSKQTPKHHQIDISVANSSKQEGKAKKPN